MGSESETPGEEVGGHLGLQYPLEPTRDMSERPLLT